MGMFRVRLLTSAALAGLTLLLAACSSSTPAPAGTGQPAAGQQPGGQPAASPAGTPKRGGVYTRRAGPDSYGGTDPAMGQQSYNVWPIMSEYLLRVEPETWKLVPAAVEQWEFSPDNLTLTLHLRKGMKFHNKPPVNGREVEAKDVVYTLKGITGQLYPQLPTVRFPRRSQFEQMTDAVAVDKYTVKVTLSEPSSTFLEGLAEYRAGIVIPDQLRESFGGLDSLVTPDVARYISAGPFILTKFANQVEAEFDRNPEYWEMAADGKPKPYLDKVRYVWISDTGTYNAAFIAGQIDLVELNKTDDRNFILSQKKDTQIRTFSPPSCWERIAFNLNRKPFDDVRVRKALQLVLNPVESGQQFFGEWEGKPVWRYPGPLPWVFPEAIPQEELAKLPGFRLPKDQDIAEAKRLMKEAGLENGFEFEMITIASRKEYSEIAQQQIRRAFPNIKVNLKVVDNAINHQLAAEANFDTQYYCHIHEASAVGQMKTPYHTKGGRNYPRFSDAKMDELLDQAGRELNDEKRTKLLREAQVYALELVPFITTLHNARQWGFQPYVRNYRLGAATSERTWYKEVWLDK